MLEPGSPCLFDSLRLARDPSPFGGLRDAACPSARIWCTSARHHSIKDGTVIGPYCTFQVKADVWSLGTIFLEILKGSHPIANRDSGMDANLVLAKLMRTFGNP
jgi:hypothetical protein